MTTSKLGIKFTKSQLEIKIRRVLGELITTPKSDFTEIVEESNNEGHVGGTDITSGPLASPRFVPGSSAGAPAP